MTAWNHTRNYTTLTDAIHMAPIAVSFVIA